jgi:two-component sensor histidine kinase/integral membrane sensor domain MASE1
LSTTEGHHSDVENRVPFLGGRSFVHVALGASAVFVAYFFAARLSLALISPSSGVAVFWPAAGVASGLIIALGPTSRLPVALGVMPATIAANLLEDSNLPASIIFAVCNAAEALLIGWLVKTNLSENPTLDSLRHVLGFLAATAVGTAVSGIGGTAGYILFHDLGASAPGIWFAWFASDALGVVTVAPVLIGLITMAQSLPEKSELLEGLVALVAIALVSILGFSSPTEQWFTILPISLVLPMAFWVAARCPPVFAASAALIVAFAAVWTITFGIGRLGDAAVPLTDRVLAAQVALVAMSSVLLALAALFQERRRSEVALSEGKDRLQESNDRLQLALAAAKRSEDQQTRLNAELDHRVKNVLACVAAIAQHASESSTSRDDFLDALNGRIRSLANTHILLSQSRWQGVDLAELVQTELAPCARNDNTIIEGPSLSVAAEAAQTVAMVIHELATNAAKYGAHSNCNGQISVRWRSQSNGSERRGLVLEWRETGGPLVRTPHAFGHGTNVIRELIPYELGGTVDYVLAPDGVRCKLEIPAPWLSIGTRQHAALNRADAQLYHGSQSIQSD